MEIVAHALWAGAAATTANRKSRWRIPRLGFALWATFPDVFAFGPMITYALWLRITTGEVQRRHFGLPLYDLGHSLLVFAVVYGLVWLFARRPVMGMLGWLMHILIDVPTHSASYHATNVFWPLSNWGFDGIPWWTPWLWVCTYAGIVVVYAVMWRKGWFTRKRAPEVVEVGSPR